MRDVRFGCTLCGRCCHGHSLPLTFDEAITWLQDGGKVGMFCEAHPFLTGEEPITLHRRKRSFHASCGTSHVPVTAILVALNPGACHHLQADMKCGAYEKRPLVCRIYPAEINPFIQLNQAAKVCPPEAWQQGDLLLKDGHLLRLIEQSRETDRNDTVRKALLCQAIGIQVAAVAGEGYISYEPEETTFLQALLSVRQAIGRPLTKWSLYSPVAATSSLLKARGLNVLDKTPYQFLWAAPVPEITN